jgi:hypothetical protein
MLRIDRLNESFGWGIMPTSELKPALQGETSVEIVSLGSDRSDAVGIDLHCDRNRKKHSASYCAYLNIEKDERRWLPAQ